MDEKLLKDAQWRKSLSISYFNSLNAAIALATPSAQVLDEDELLDLVKRYRDIFIEEHKNYYANTIAKVGMNYKPEDAIKKLKAVKSREELHTVWLMFSEDERRDDEISRLAHDLKTKYENS